MMSVAAKLNVRAGNLPLKDQFSFLPYIREGTIKIIKIIKMIRASETVISNLLVCDLLLYFESAYIISRSGNVCNFRHSKSIIVFWERFFMVRAY